MADINKAIIMTVKNGKVLFGINDALRSAKAGRAKLIIVAENCPSRVRDAVHFYCRLSNVPIIVYNGTSIDLGIVCGKSFTVSALTVREPGDSDILNLTGETNV